MILPDVLDSNLKLVFCGTAASAVSAQEVAYYASPSNAFWRTLHQVGLTPRLFAAKEFPQLLELGIGLTDIAKYAVGNDSDLEKSDFDSEALSKKIKQYQPQHLAFTSKKAASMYFGTSTRKIAYGKQDTRLEQTQFWVLPSPSGAARGYWDISIWQNLANHINTGK